MLVDLLGKGIEIASLSRELRLATTEWPMMPGSNRWFVILLLSTEFLLPGSAWQGTNDIGILWPSVEVLLTVTCSGGCLRMTRKFILIEFGHVYQS